MKASEMQNVLTFSDLSGMILYLINTVSLTKMWSIRREISSSNGQTITYNNSNGGPQVHGRYEQAIVKVRFSETFQEVIEFEVELNPVPIHDDLQGKDVIVTWKMLDGFNANKTFWTDSNGLEMQERHFSKFQHKMDFFKNQSLTFNDIAGNYYPVPFAISMRDFSNSSNL